MEKKISVLVPASVPLDKSAAPPWAGGFKTEPRPGPCLQTHSPTDQFRPTCAVPTWSSLVSEVVGGFDDSAYTLPFFHCAQFFPLASFRRMHSFVALLLHASAKRQTRYHSFCQMTECPFRESVNPFARQNSWTFSSSIRQTQYGKLPSADLSNCG